METADSSTMPVYVYYQKYDPEESSTRNMLPPYLEDESSRPSEMLVPTNGIYPNAKKI